MNKAKLVARSRKRRNGVGKPIGASLLFSRADNDDDDDDNNRNSTTRGRQSGSMAAATPMNGAEGETTVSNGDDDVDEEIYDDFDFYTAQLEKVGGLTWLLRVSHAVW